MPRVYTLGRVTAGVLRSTGPMVGSVRYDKTDRTNTVLLNTPTNRFLSYIASFVE
jgi:hypothetical protein